MTIAVRAAVLALAGCALCGQQPSSLLKILDEELGRNFSLLKAKADPPPYFLSYTALEEESDVISASMGTLTNQSHTQARYLDVTVRVGTPELDNFHRINGGRQQLGSAVQIPLDGGPNAVKRIAWLETDRVYRLAAQQLIQIKTNQQVRVARQDDSADFSKERPAQYTDTPTKMRGATAEWAIRLRKLSARFNNYPGVLASNVTFVAQRQIKYLVNTEGTRIQEGRDTAQIVVTARGKAADGMDLGVNETFEAEDPGRLPKDEAILAAVDKAGSDLSALLKAPVIDPFVGPAILSGLASGVFFHEIFGHRIEGQRQKDDSEG